MRWPARASCARGRWAMSLPARLRFGLQGRRRTRGRRCRCVALVHGTSRDDKCWPEAQWLELGRRLIAQGFTLGLPHGNDAERERGERLAAALGPQAQVWPRLDLGQLTDRLAACAGVIGVDSGLSHIAVALDLPHVQIYNFDTAWRTGPPAIRLGAAAAASRVRAAHTLHGRSVAGMAAGASDLMIRSLYSLLAIRRPAVPAPQAQAPRGQAEPGYLQAVEERFGHYSGTRRAGRVVDPCRLARRNARRGHPHRTPAQPQAGLARPAHAWHGHRPGRRRAAAADGRSCRPGCLGTRPRRCGVSSIISSRAPAC